MSLILEGTQLGPYTVVRPLGAGGMGEVYLASDPRLEREVAIKVLPFEFSFDPERLERFQREAKLLASLNHPNIATIYGLEEGDGGVRCLILERIEGETLEERLKAGALPLAVALELAIQLADALDAAHERGVIHRDLKPGNIMVTPRGQLKVLDFGLAKRSHPHAPDAPPTALGNYDGEEIVGTPGYMSPEQIQAQPQDSRTDVFAYGCMLYEMLAGRPAFAGSNTLELTAATLHETPDWAALPADAAGPLQPMLDNCLAKEPEQRTLSMAAVRGALRDLQDAGKGSGAERASQYIPAAPGRPAAPSAASRRLPRQLSSFVGREQETEACLALLRESRILTLTGAGGCGKTRLALHVAESFLEGSAQPAWFADLAPLHDGARVLQTVSDSVGAKGDSEAALAAALSAALAGGAGLLILDNCEHVLQACVDLAGPLLSECPGLRLVATSREALALHGEQTYPVAPLGLPDRRARVTARSVSTCESGRLFAERAARVSPNFVISDANAEGVLDILRRLDGIPFAIELAAARIKVLSVEQIRAKLDDRFRLLTSGSCDALPRQQTLRATIQWSYDQLVEEEKQLCRALSIFAGGWSLESATAVCGEGRDEFEVLDVLGRLADKSLVVVERDAAENARYRFLETVRQFAMDEREAAGEGAALAERHLEFFLALAEEAEPHLRSSGQAVWLRRLDAENENLMAAHTECGREAGGVERGLRLVGALWRFWYSRGHFRQARRALAEALARPGAEQPSALRVGVLRAEAGIALMQNDYESSRALYEEMAGLCRQMGDVMGTARALNGLGIVSKTLHEFEAAVAYYKESLEAFQALGDRPDAAVVLANLGSLHMETRDYSGAKPHIEAGLALCREVGDSQGVAKGLLNGAMVCTHTGDSAGARARLLEGLPMVRDLGDRRYAAFALETTSELAALVGRHALAALLSGSAAGLREDLGAPLRTQEQHEHQLAMDVAREALGAAAFEEACNKGRLLGLEAALEEARAWLLEEAGAA